MVEMKSFFDENTYFKSKKSETHRQFEIENVLKVGKLSTTISDTVADQCNKLISHHVKDSLRIVKNEIKKYASDVEVFREINKLRHVRANMIENFGTYQMIYQCLSYYGKNKAHFDRIKPKAPIAEVDKIYRQSNRILTLISDKMAKNQAKNFTARSLLKYPISAIGTKAKESSHEKGGSSVIVNTGHSSQPDANDLSRDNLPDDIYFTEDIYVN